MCFLSFNGDRQFEIQFSQNQKFKNPLNDIVDVVGGDAVLVSSVADIHVIFAEVVWNLY